MKSIYRDSVGRKAREHSSSGGEIMFSCLIVENLSETLERALC